MPAVDDETSDEEREEDRGAEERAAVACAQWIGRVTYAYSEW